MFVKIGPYKNHWLSPYTILEKVLFWKNWENIDYDEPWVEKWADRLLPFCNLLKKIREVINPYRCKVKIHNYDTWNMDATLASIIYPLLKQLKEQKQGYGFVDDADAPEELNSKYAPAENQYEWDQNAKARWDWVLDEMIWAFEQLDNDNWEEQFHSGESDIDFQPCENNPNLHTLVHGPNHTHKFDAEGYKKFSARIDNGLTLFGKYYRGLWT